MKSHKLRHALYLLFNIVLYLIIGGLFGLWIVFAARFHGEEYVSRPLHLAVILLSFYAGVVLHTILHEGGHMVFGLLTGYGFVSFRVFRWTWVRQNGRLTVKQYSLPGTMGQCLLSPPRGYADMAEAPFVLYHLGGVLANLIFSVVFAALTLLLPGIYVRMICTGLALAGFMLACVNAIPAEPGRLNNDGRNLLELCRSADARRDIHKQLEAVALQAAGQRLRDMPDSVFEGNMEAAKTSMISATVFALQENRLMDEQNFKEAEALIALLTETDRALSSQLQKTLLELDRLYLRALAGECPAPDKKELKILKAYRALLPVCRTGFALALADGDAKKAESVLADFERLAADYPYAGELESERMLVDLARDRIGREHGLLLDNFNRIQ